MALETIASSCPTCSAALSFEPGTDQLRCRHCKTAVPIPSPGPVPAPLPFDRWAGAAMTSEVAREVRSVECRTCGGRTELEAKATAGKCPFCKTPFVNEPSAQEVMRPQAVVPFVVPKEKAAELLATWISSRRFAPKALKREASVDRLSGVYVPAWRFDAETTTDYDGERGEHRTVQKVVRDSEGREHTESTQVTDWYPASGTVEVDFDDLDVVASKGVHDDLAPVLGGSGFASLRPFREEYLYGFSAETYEVPLRDAFERAKTQMAGTITTAVNHDIGGDEQRIRRRSTSYSAVAFLLVALPVWIVAYTFQGKVYQVLIDGHGGDIKGKRPFSPAKIIALVAVVVVVIVAIVVAVVVSKKN